MTERFLATGLTSVRDKKLQLGMTEDILLWKPLGQHHVVRLVLHHLRLPLPEDPLLQSAEDVEEQPPFFFRHFGGC